MKKGLVKVNKDISKEKTVFIVDAIIKVLSK